MNNSGNDISLCYSAFRIVTPKTEASSCASTCPQRQLVLNNLIYQNPFQCSEFTLADSPHTLRQHE